MDKNLKKISWKEAATGGLYLGAVMVLLSAGDYLLRDTAVALLPGVLRFLAILTFSYHFTRRISYLYADDGFSFTQSIGFILKMMIFAGVIAGLGQCVMVNYVAPEYYYGILRDGFMTQTQSFGMNFSEEQLEALLKVYMPMIKNPLVMAVSGIFNMVIFGGLLGVMVSVFTKRPANPYAGDNNAQQ